MDRYQQIVRVSFYGHTHKEEIAVTYAINTNDNIGLSFTAGSLTTYQGRNPSFSVVEMDAEYMVPVSYKTYFLNISRINS